MPSTSKKQANFMRAVANNPKFAKKVGVPVSVGAEYLRADIGKRHYRQDTKRDYTGPYSSKGDDKMNKAKKGIRKMQVGGATAMPDSVKGSAPVTSGSRPFNTPTLPSQASTQATQAMANRGVGAGSYGRGMEMRNIPTLPDQASQRARDMMAARLAARNPITTPGGPAPLVPEVMPPAAAVLPAAAAPAFKKGGRVKKMAGGGGTNPRKGGALYNLGTNQNPRGMNTGGKVPSAPSLPSQASSKASDALSSRFAGGRTGMKQGGSVKKYAAGGSVKASSRADGCCMRGKTKGRMR